MTPTCIKIPTHVILHSPTLKPKAASAAHSRYQKRRDEVNLNLRNPTATISPSPSPFPILATPLIMLAAASSSSTWLRARRSRYLFLLICSPILIPFLCATFPFLCAAELCLRLCRRRRIKTAHGADEEVEERLRRCEEGRGGEREEMGLLQRYLEDQLLLVGSVYDCGDDDVDDRLYHEIHDYDNDSKTTPLLA
ncbi:PREDICTED: uncharacterized protein LOC103319277 [Prunus mume]|uniref:Uncharacterized protein LOC103319277 n=1 Tax=Prunus mume TaxID=102107 RepID=A0ABM0N3J3_PRUMU|nr:PREDICTED: uncharacterized protein LOC103319277 [Prunus mume]